MSAQKNSWTRAVYEVGILKKEKLFIELNNYLIWALHHAISYTISIFHLLECLNSFIYGWAQNWKWHILYKSKTGSTTNCILKTSLKTCKSIKVLLFVFSYATKENMQRKV